jgi:nitrate reductase NapAB chaperone NapD
MTTQLLELNEAQTAIYNRSNLRRAIKDFDDTEIAGITLRDNLVVVVRTDGSEQTYPTGNSSYCLPGIYATP